MPRQLPAQIKTTAGPDLSHRVGEVRLVEPGVFGVFVGEGQLEGVGWAGSYAPVEGDVVYVLRRNAGWFVVDKIREFG